MLLRPMDASQPDCGRVGEDKGCVQPLGDLCACGSVGTLCWRIVLPWPEL